MKARIKTILHFIAIMKVFHNMHIHKFNRDIKIILLQPSKPQLLP